MVADTQDKKFLFTKESLDSLPNSVKAQTFYFDSRQRNLAICVTPKGLKTFYLYKKHDGDKIIDRIGRYPEMPISLARTKCSEKLSQIEKGEDIKAQKRAEREQITLNDFFKKYVEREARPHKKSFQFEETIYRVHIQNSLGKLKLNEITQDKVFKLHASIGDSGKGKKTVANRVLNLISLLFNRAYIWEYLTDSYNPAKTVKRYKEESRERFMQLSELAYLYSALLEEPSKDVRDFILIGLFTGARRQNILSMEWDEIQFQQAVWNIPKGKSKNGKTLNVHLCDTVLDVLKERKTHTKGKYVFPSDKSDDGHMGPPRRGWTRVMRAASVAKWKNDETSSALVIEVENALKKTSGMVEVSLLSLYDMVVREADKQNVSLAPASMDLRIHDLRRTLGSTLNNDGNSLQLIGNILGHSNLESTQVYARTSSDPIREAMKATEQTLLEALHGK